MLANYDLYDFKHDYDFEESSCYIVEYRVYLEAFNYVTFFELKFIRNKYGRWYVKGGGVEAPEEIRNQLEQLHLKRIQKNGAKNE